MATARKWSNVAVAMQSALAATIPITGISKAAEGVVTANNTFVAGDFVLLSVQGMRQVDDRVFRVKSPTGANFILEGEDTTAFDGFSSGTVQKITFGTSITTATSISSSGGEFDFLDTTTIHQGARSQVPGLPSAATFTFDNIWDVSDAGLKAMKSASDSQGKRAFMFTFGVGGQIMVFNGYVGASLLPGGSAQQLVTTKTAITMNGTPTYYGS
ncbi:phage tail tube protein [Pseudomonas sp.]|uniref:phage tail tube protein n=1 Tax=Pseudomonas sp. TaxID=306 RepID=UPI003F3102DA